MKICTKCGIEQTYDQFYKRARSYDGYRPECKGCGKAAAKAWGADNQERKLTAAKIYREGNKEKVVEAARLWRIENPEANAESLRKYRESNREKINEAARLYRAENPDKVKEARKTFYEKNIEECREANRRWRLNNPDKRAAAGAKYRAASLTATPVWADHEAIEALYEKAAFLTALHGVPFHVDHIVPLQSTIVCGLHCEFNLQVMKGTDNASKGNRYWPDMP